MTKNKKSLREIADGAAANWSNLEFAAKEARAAYNAFAMLQRFDLRNHLTANPSLATFRMAELYLAQLIAEAARDAAGVDTALALDSAELADGDPLAIARDPVALAADLAAFAAERSALQAQLVELDSRMATRVASARRAENARTARREREGLPVGGSRGNPQAITNAENDILRIAAACEESRLRKLNEEKERDLLRAC
jgi:hypothetical protein